MIINNAKILFILKRRHYGDYDYPDAPCDAENPDIPRLTSGLYNSALFVEKMLLNSGIHCKLVEVTDNNDIDREVYHFKPTHVIIEGLWVVPEKFEILTKLHPYVKWIVRLHSEIPFLAMEGIAIEWILRYVLHHNVLVACNSSHAVGNLRQLVKANHENWSDFTLEEKVWFLPNYYPTTDKPEEKEREKRNSPLHFGCFGAVRPLKNQLIQAMAAINYATKHNRVLHFHMNGSRLEQGGNNNFKNIEALFVGTKNVLVAHPWMPHYDFLKLVRQMDLSMCVSFSETFCIVAADSVNERVPLVASKEINWCSPFSHADPTDINSIDTVIHRMLNPITKHIFTEINYRKLIDYCKDSKDV